MTMSTKSPTSTHTHHCWYHALPPPLVLMLTSSCASCAATWAATTMDCAATRIGARARRNAFFMRCMISVSCPRSFIGWTDGTEMATHPAAAGPGSATAAGDFLLLLQLQQGHGSFRA